MVVFILILLVMLAVAAAVASPWRRPGDPERHAAETKLIAAGEVVMNLEAARDQKYREIRDAELDRQTGKLSDADFQAIDSTLRADAIEILRQLDRAQTRLGKLRASEGESASDGELAAEDEPAADELPSLPQ